MAAIHSKLGSEQLHIKIQNYVEGTIGEYDSKPGILPYTAPGFVMGVNENDLALIETSKQIEYSSHVNAVMLPALNESTVAPNVQVIATGFGQRNSSNWWILRYLTLNTITHSECLETFPDLGNTTVCAKGIESNGGSLCEEYGSPLVLDQYNQSFVGIYQASKGTCAKGSPERFVNIGSFIPWMRETARFATLDPDTYYRDDNNVLNVTDLWQVKQNRSDAYNFSLFSVMVSVNNRGPHFES